MTVISALALWLIASVPVSIIVGAVLGSDDRHNRVSGELIKLERRRSLKIGA
jgi:hypothetical protein